MAEAKPLEEWISPKEGEVYLIHNEAEEETDRWQLFRLHRFEENRFYVLEGFLLRDVMPYRRPMSVNRSYRSRSISAAFTGNEIKPVLEETFPESAPLQLMALKRITQE